MAQPKYHILKEYANGVMDEKGKFYPYSYSQATLAAKPNTRYYIKSITTAWTGTAAVVAATAVYLTAYISGISKTLAFTTVPQTTAGVWGSGSKTQDYGVLCDLSTAVDLTPATTTPSEANIVYAEIYENPGEYQG